MMEEESSLGSALKTATRWRSSPPIRLTLLSKQISLLSFTALRLSPECPELPQPDAHCQGPQLHPKKHHRLPPPALLTQDCAGDSGFRGQSWREEWWNWY